MSGHSHTVSFSASSKLYAGVLATLLVLTAITVGASRIDFGEGNVVIAMVIATIKATIVALFFMHLRHDKPVNAIAFTSSLFFLALFLGFCLIDAKSRVTPVVVGLKPIPSMPNAPGVAPHVPPGTPLPGFGPPVVAAPAPAATPAAPGAPAPAAHAPEHH